MCRKYDKCGTFFYIKGGFEDGMCCVHESIDRKTSRRWKRAGKSKRDIDNYCNKNGYIISDYYIDDGYTGANMDRPELQRLISDCVAKE